MFNNLYICLHLPVQYFPPLYLFDMADIQPVNHYNLKIPFCRSSIYTAVSTIYPCFSFSFFFMHYLTLVPLQQHPIFSINFSRSFWILTLSLQDLLILLRQVQSVNLISIFCIPSSRSLMQALGQIPAETHMIHSSILEVNQHCVWLSKLFCIDLVAVSSGLSFLSLNLKMPQVKVLQTKYQTPPFTPLSAKLITLQQKETKLVWQDSFLRNLCWSLSWLSTHTVIRYSWDTKKVRERERVFTHATWLKSLCIAMYHGATRDHHERR